MTELRSSDAGKTPELMRDGPYLVVRQRRVEYPGDCIICGAPARERVTITVRKTSRILALLGMFGAFIYFAAPTAKLCAGLCSTHLPGELQMRKLLWLLIVFGTVGLVLAIALHSEPDLVLLGVLTCMLFFNVAMILEIARPKLLRGVNADRHYLWIDQVAPVLLDRLPEVGGRE